MNDMKLKIQYWLLVVLMVAGVSFTLTTLMNWLIPSPFILLILELMALGLFLVIRKTDDKKKEMALLFTIAMYIDLLITSTVYHVWSFETIFTKLEMTRFSLFLFFLISVILIITYVRAKRSYKKVQGNQPHSDSWHVSKNELKKIQNSDDIYINLGIFEKTDGK